MKPTFFLSIRLPLLGLLILALLGVTACLTGAAHACCLQPATDVRAVQVLRGIPEAMPCCEATSSTVLKRLPETGFGPFVLLSAPPRPVDVQRLLDAGITGDDISMRAGGFRKNQSRRHRELSVFRN